MSLFISIIASFVGVGVFLLTLTPKQVNQTKFRIYAIVIGTLCAFIARALCSSIVN